MAPNPLISIFNDQFFLFVQDIRTVFPGDVDLSATEKALTMVRKANPKLLYQAWNTHIGSKYKAEIQAGNIAFFLHKDYKDDLTGQEHMEKILTAIDRLRTPIQQMNAADQMKTMKHIQNLTQLAEMCMAA